MRHKNISYKISSHLSTEMIEYLEVTCVIFSFSNFIFDILIAKKYSAITIIGLIIGILNAIAPMERLNKYLFKIESKDEIVSYDEAEEKYFETVNFTFLINL